MDENKYEISDEEMASLVDALDNMLDDEEPDFYGTSRKLHGMSCMRTPALTWTSGLIS